MVKSPKNNFAHFNMSQTSVIEYTKYPGESVIEDIIALMSDTLSEPYSIYTYRFFLAVYSFFIFISDTVNFFFLFLNSLFTLFIKSQPNVSLIV